MNNVFYLPASALEEYLKNYDRGISTKDYEYHIALYAHEFYEKHLKEEFVIAFEVNDKPHNYPPNMEPMSLDVLRDIMINHLKEDTDVDFALAPKHNDEKIGYPFQLKKFVADSTAITPLTVADYINKKANHYRSSEVSMIVLPINKGNSDDQKGFDINELKNNLKVDDNALYAVFMFQNINGKASFIPIWLSSRAKAFKAN